MPLTRVTASDFLHCSPQETARLKQRYYSLDVFRGSTVALMILVNNPGNWGELFSPLAHAKWHGLTPTDLVFPFFLFAVGNAMAFVMPGLEARGRKAFLTKLIKRTLLIFATGLFLNWFPFVQWHDNQLVFRPWVDPTHPNTGVRILGVLQRIALAYCFAGLILYFLKLRGAFVVSALLLLGYWALCLFANPTDPYSLDGWFGTAIDKKLLGVAHLYKGEGRPFDPEGLVSTIPAIVQVIFGYLAGNYIREKGKSYEMLSNLFVAGCLLAFAGLCWGLSFPINKKIWTSSYVLYTSGLALLVLSVLIYLIEFRESKGGWSRFFAVFGLNPLFIYVLSGLIPKSLRLIRIPNGSDSSGAPQFTSPLPWFYETACRPLFDNLKAGSLFYALVFVLFFWVIAWWMDRKRIYIRV